MLDDYICDIQCEDYYGDEKVKHLTFPQNCDIIK